VSSETEDLQRILSEASHDLANRFHRSYYFLDLLADSVDAEGLQHLERLRETLEDIESIARRALQFVRPVEIRTIRVRLEDLVASLRQHCGLAGITVAGDAEAGRLEVAVDPARISEVLATLCRAALGNGEGQGPIRVELLGGNPAGLRLHAQGALADDGLALALAARVVGLHGGSLEAGPFPDGAAPFLTLRLPVVTGGS
jgi:signal transduction histidine kinase